MKRISLLTALCAATLLASAQTATPDYERLDLPSGKLWATFNVGATAPEEIGSLFAWGEIVTKERYTWGNYIHGEINAIEKYCTDITSGRYRTADSLSTLQAADDVATRTWGSEWHIPTKEDWQELIDGCIWAWTTDYEGKGISGYIVTSKDDPDSYIFLPTTGYRDDKFSLSTDKYGNYWTSALSEGNPYNAWHAGFSSRQVSLFTSARYLGYAIRPVQNKKP